MKNKIISIVAILLLVLSLGGCKSKDKSEANDTNETTSVPIVIVDENSSETTQSQIDEITDKWENSTPKLEIEDSKKPTESTGGKDSATGNNSDNKPNSSVSGEEQNNSSKDNSSSEETTPSEDSSSSEEENTSKVPDDGYFNVTV